MSPSLISVLISVFVVLMVVILAQRKKQP